MSAEEPLPPPSSPARRKSNQRLVLELFIVTTGVLIALMVDSLVEWNHYRMLVRDARANIALELASNRKEVQFGVEAAPKTGSQIDIAQRFAEQLIAKGVTEINSMNIDFHMADLNAAAWRSAEQTGALAHMNYAEVQRYARLYSLQQLFDDRQRQTFESMSLALSIMGAADDPTKAAPEDLRIFRQRLMDLRAQVFITTQVAEHLVQRYDETLNGRPK